MGRHIFVVMATIALFGRARRRGVGLRHKKVRHACTGNRVPPPCALRRVVGSFSANTLQIIGIPSIVQAATPASFSTGSLKSRLERFNFRGQCCWPCRVDMVGAASRPCGCGSALGAGGSYGSGIGGSSIDGGGLSAGGGGVAGSTGPALTPGTWFVSQGDPWLHAFCAADRGRGFTSSDGLRRFSLRRRSKHYAG